MPADDAAAAVIDGEPLELELQDGRELAIIMSDSDGGFDARGPIPE